MQSRVMVSGRHRHRDGHGGPRWRWPLLGFSAGGGVVAAVILAVGLGQVTSPRACAAELSAAGPGTQTATHYVLQGLPNCSYSPPADGLYAALPPAEYASAAACGEYVQVSGPDGSVRVKVIDQCPDCAAGHIDLSETAFARLAPLSAGLVNVSYTPLADPPPPAPVSVEVKQGSSQYWLALLADNTGNPLASVQVQTPSGWLPLARASYNYWIAQSGAGPGPFTVRLTDTQGHQATVSGITLSPGAVQPTKTWMYGAGGDPAPATPAPATSRAAAAPTASAATASAAPARTAAATARPAAARAASLTTGAPATGPPAAVAQRSRQASPAPSARSSC
jgi:expansin (peptidoglycan-binding protein)